MISRQILIGLQFLHEECSVVHTDMKPENILFSVCHAEQNALRESAKEAAFQVRDAVQSGTNLKKFNFGRNICKLDPSLAFSSGRAVIVDFGNACWEIKPFTDDIQTRQYRAPEVVLRCGYDSKADIWSLACIVFELATGDFLFDPHTSEFYDRDEDHLALMMELLGPVPLDIRARGELTKDLYNDRGELRHITKLNFWSLGDVLREKYRYHHDDACELASFLLPMLYYNTEERPSARDLLQHSFVNTPPTIEVAERAMKNLPLGEGDLGVQKVEGNKDGDDPNTENDIEGGNEE